MKKEIKAFESALKILSVIKTELSKSSETKVIINKTDELEIEDYDSASHKFKYINRENQEKLDLIFLILGKSDAATQLNKITEVEEYFKEEKRKYEDYYHSHRKLILTSGLLFGVLICVLLM